MIYSRQNNFAIATVLSVCFFIQVLCSNMLLLNSYAIDTSKENKGIVPVVTFDASKVSPGQLFSLDFALSNVQSGDKTNSVVFYISYDNRAFETKTGNIELDCTDTLNYLKFIKKSQSSGNVNVVQVSYISQTDVALINNKKLLSLRFKVKSDATSGNKGFSILPANMIDSNFKVYPFNGGALYTTSLELINGKVATPSPSPSSSPSPSASPTTQASPTPIYSGSSNSSSNSEYSTASPTATGTPTATPRPIQTPTSTAIATPSQASLPTPTPTSSPKISGEGESSQSEKKSELEIEATPRIPAGGAFADLENHWAQKAILDLFARDIISGYPDGSIKPSLEISRAEAITAIVKAIHLDISQRGATAFSDDTKIAEWVRPYIKAASEKGIVSGYEDRSFRPNNKVSRAEFVTMVISASAFDKEKADQLDFKDAASIPSWSRNRILVALGMGIVHGYPDRTFCPQKNITRAEIFTVIWKCLNRK